MSRMRVYVLERLQPDEIRSLLQRTLTEEERGLGSMHLSVKPDALIQLSRLADGDARRGLTLLEAVAEFVGKSGTITAEAVTTVSQRTILSYDKGGEEHYNLISALHKTIRGGDPDAALYWLARMLASGEEPMYILRRLVRFASEDIGLADSYALTLTLNARDAYHFLGSPEGELAIAQAVIYMACAPKSNASYTAFDKAKKDALQKGSLPVPLWLRNAPTGLMKALDYGKDYKYPHKYENNITDQEYFPSDLGGTIYFRPAMRGREAKMAEYLARFRECRSQLAKEAKPADTLHKANEQN